MYIEGKCGEDLQSEAVYRPVLNISLNPWFNTVHQSLIQPLLYSFNQRVMDYVMYGGSSVFSSLILVDVSAPL